MRDLPTGPSLSALARAVLLEELLPLLPRDRQFEARLVAAAMAIAEREAAAGEAPSEWVVRSMQRLYGAGDCDLRMRRVAEDLRHGAFERDEMDERAARILLWRLTIAKLRVANPRFLAANGFSEELS